MFPFILSANKIVHIILFQLETFFSELQGVDHPDESTMNLLSNSNRPLNRVCPSSFGIFGYFEHDVGLGTSGTRTVRSSSGPGNGVHFGVKGATSRS